MAKRFNFEVSVLLTQEGNAWVAQCLQYDVTAQGSSIASAKENFERMFVGQIIADISVGRDPLEAIPQAPRLYWDKFEHGEKLSERKPFYVGDAVPAAYMIQAMAQDFRVAA